MRDDPGIKAILFDFGGVLAEEGFRNGLQQLARQQGLDERWIFEAGMDSVYQSGWVVGQGTEADFWRLLGNKTGLRGDPQKMREIILASFVVRPSMLKLVDRLRRHGLVVGLLSDQTEWLDELDRRYDLYRHFDKIYISYRLGKGKRDPALFDEIARDLSLAPDQIVFIDDNSGNIERARQRGWHGLLFENERQLLDSLKNLGVS